MTADPQLTFEGRVQLARRAQAAAGTDTYRAPELWQAMLRPGKTGGRRAQEVTTDKVDIWSLTLTLALALALTLIGWGGAGTWIRPE